MTASVASPAFIPKRSGLARFISGYGQELVIALAILALFEVVSSFNKLFL